MIKFFRKIRQRLLTESKFSKYLLYAIGEIVLVVIGILIALSINNWNEDQKDRAKEQEILIQLKEDYETDLSQLEEKMFQRTSIIQVSRNLLKAIDQGTQLHPDSLAMMCKTLYKDPTFDSIKNDLIGSGNLRMIQNKELKRLLSNWSSDVVGLQEIEVIWSDQVLKTVSPFFRTSGLSRNALEAWWSDPSTKSYLLNKSFPSEGLDIGRSKKPVDVGSILGSTELEGIVATAMSYNQAANLQSIALVERIELILRLIEEEIEEEK